MKKLSSILVLSICFLVFQSGVGEQNVSHASWDQLLKANVSANGKVNYEGFNSSKDKLDAYLAQLSKNAPTASWAKNEVKAYWINAYNAYTVKLILNNYPLKSIMDINGGKAWDLKFIEIGGKQYSLNNIEHDILRAKHKDARIHFAVNCASFSCPKLSNKAFTSANIEAQLEQLSKSFINNNAKNQIQANSVKISKLFDWYKSDFTTNGSLIDFLNKYSNTKINANATIGHMDYNWNLNN